MDSAAVCVRETVKLEKSPGSLVSFGAEKAIVSVDRFLLCAVSDLAELEVKWKIARL